MNDRVLHIENDMIGFRKWEDLITTPVVIEKSPISSEELKEILTFEPADDSDIIV